MSVEAADKELRAVQIKAVGPEFHGPDAETLLEYMLGLELILLIDHGGLMRLAVGGSHTELRAQRVKIGRVRAPELRVRNTGLQRHPDGLSALRVRRGQLTRKLQRAVLRDGGILVKMRGDIVSYNIPLHIENVGVTCIILCGIERTCDVDLRLDHIYRRCRNENVLN